MGVLILKSSPTIGGAVAHGAPYTVSGSGFGTRSNNNTQSKTWYGVSHLHFRYTTFENGAPLAATNGAWQTATNGFEPVDGCSPGDARLTIITGSGGQDPYFLRRTDFAASPDRLGGMGVTAADTNGEFSAGSTLYATYRVRQVSHEGGNVKLFRAYTNNGSVFISTCAGSRASPAGYDYTAVREPLPYVGQSFETAIEMASPPALNTWRLEEVLLRGSSSANSWIRHNGNKVTLQNSIPFSSTNLPIYDTTDNISNHTIDFPMMIETATGNDLMVDYDFIAVDKTPARVLLGNASTYAACTNFEVQCLSSWSATSIGVVINQGQHASLSGKYFYVFDTSDNLVNSNGIALV